MRAILVRGPGQVSVEEVPDPVVGPADALVRVHACGLCGTDIGHVSRGGLAGPGPEPLALGHEISGVVEEVGTEVDGIEVGDRVVVHPGDARLGRIGNGDAVGGLADRLLVRQAAGRLLRVPDDLDLTVASLTEPVAVGMHAAQRLELEAGSSVVVVGCGPIGLAALATLIDEGARSAVAVDPSSTRRDLAIKLGAHAAVAPEDLWSTLIDLHGKHPSWPGTPATNGFVEASGSAEMLGELVSKSAPKSRISVPALHRHDVPINMLMVMAKELEIRGSIEYPERFSDALDLLLRRDLSPMITDLISLEEAAAALLEPARLRSVGKTVAVLGGES